MNKSVWTCELMEIPWIRNTAIGFCCLGYMGVLILCVESKFPALGEPEFQRWAREVFWLWVKVFGVTALTLFSITSFAFGFLPDHQTSRGHRLLIRWFWIECVLAAFVSTAYCISEVFPLQTWRTAIKTVIEAAH